MRRPVRIGAVVLGLLVAVAGVTAVLVAVVPGPAPAPPPDRYAVEQVAQRYRALGATLLDGALRCAPSRRTRRGPSTWPATSTPGRRS